MLEGLGSHRGHLRETYLSKAVAPARRWNGMIKKLDAAVPPTVEDGAGSDLERRLARYRRRVEAEGRPRSLKLIDLAMEDAAKKGRWAG